MRILYVEDDPTAQEFVTRGLRHRGFDLTEASRGEEGLALAQRGGFDLIILDVMLPDLDGFSVLRELRRTGVGTPVLFLSARGEPSDRIQGLDLGADDYLAKPFAFGELVSRIHAVSRRALGTPDDGCFRVADLVVDVRRHRAERGGRLLELTARQFSILEVLVRSSGCVLSRSMLLERVWGAEFEALSNVIDVHIRCLRRAIDDPFEPKLIHTVKGVGYVLEQRGASRPKSEAMPSVQRTLA
jgi:two-component system copper resistance phosphate regulon response regulator CusR